MKKVLCINAGGVGNLHGVRMRRLTQALEADLTHYDLDRTVNRLVQIQTVLKLVKSQKWDLVYQESSGIGAGAALILARLLWKQPFIVSSGDPIGGFFHVTKGALMGQFFGLYEKLLYRCCTAFVGWTPYLTGSALLLGAKRSVTIEGAVDLDVFTRYDDARRRELKQAYGIPEDHLVCGVVGSLNWNELRQYCYGRELVESLKYLKRDDVSFLIVGDGTGRAKLEAAIPEGLKDRVVFTGRVPEAEVAQAMNAMDIGFVTQSLDRLGMYRLTTKLPEYLACGLGIAMSPIPGFYDYVNEAGWPLPACHPATDTFHQDCAAWLDGLSWDDVKAKSEAAVHIAAERFDYELIRPRFQRFVQSLMAR